MLFRLRGLPLRLALPFVLLLAFWGIALKRLDRFPPLTADEVWILSPGYKLLTRGVYGSDLFVGFNGMEQHYFEFMPLMPIVQGVSARLFGLGVWQMRFVPVVLGALTLALSFALARRLVNATAGMITMLLLVLWQWTPATARLLGSGIPLVDVSRVARYDILVPPLGLSALWAYLHARRTAQIQYDFLSGCLAGLAGLAHVYGLFWAIGLWLVLLLDRLYFSREPIRARLGAMLAGMAAAWSLWVGLILAHWKDFTGQSVLNQDRFDLWDLSFYLHNLSNEPHRYLLDLRDPAALIRPGSWLLIVGVSLTLMWLSVRVAHLRDARSLPLLVLCWLFPLLFALLIQPKVFHYLVTIAPLFAMLLAWGLARMLAARSTLWRTSAWLILGLIVIQGLSGLTRLQAKASHSISSETFLNELRQDVPPSARVILGPPQYWLGLSDRDYRSFGLPVYLSDPTATAAPISFDAALGRVSPQIVFLDPNLMLFLTDRSTPFSRARSDEFWAYMHQHRARVIAELPDGEANLVQVYQLDQ